MSAERFRRWIARLDAEAYVTMSGLRFEDLALDFARVRMTFRPELLQGGGVIHGGAIATLLDSAAAGASLSAYDERPTRLATISLHVQYLGSVRAGDVVAESRVRRRGRNVIFLDADASDEHGDPVAHAEVIYLVQP